MFEIGLSLLGIILASLYLGMICRMDKEWQLEHPDEFADFGFGYGFGGSILIFSIMVLVIKIGQLF